MKRITILIFLAINSFFLFGQVSLITEGTTVSNAQTGNWDGVNISRSSVTNLIYRNNIITSVNSSGYMLQAGDEGVSSTNNYLDGEIITGNKLIWNGTDLKSITHGIFTGYNRNALIKYNYLDRVPMAIIRKSNGMTDASGAVAYNIIKSPNVGIVIKGMNGIKIYNNTFYSAKSTAETSRGLIEIYANDSFTPAIPSTRNVIKNNIFYTKFQITNIEITESEDLNGFESDYNVFYCESGTPLFKYLGSVQTFAQWQALGYDAHSIIINPNFNNTNDLVPATRMNYGTNIGATWQTGLSASAIWSTGVSPATATQDATWQVGARVLETVVAANPVYVNSTIENAAPSALVINFNLSLSNSLPASSAFKVSVNSVTRTVNSVAVSGTKVLLTLASPVKYGDVITVAYTKPALNPLQTATGGIAQDIAVSTTTNKILAPVKDETVSVKMTISPNHVHKTINILFEYVGTASAITSVFTPEVIKISDLAGKLLVEKHLVTGVTSIRIPINLRSGIYNVELFGNALLKASQKMRIY